MVTDPSSLRIAVLIPCYNEELTVSAVVSGFRESLPSAEIFVFDNNSTDKTAENAIAAGAIVHHVAIAGKGNVVRRMFADVEADIYIMADGDATYHAPSAPSLVQKLIDDNLDMVVGVRQHDSNDAYRAGHQFGNRMLTGTMSRIFGGKFTDMLSGYRAFSRRYAKSFPAMAHGFETETELTIHALELRMPYGEVTTPYGVRPEGSTSKLRTYSDGARILKTIVGLFAVERPLQFYSLLGTASMATALILALPIFLTYAKTGLVPRFPTAILSSGLGIIGVMLLTTGLILETVTIGRREAKRLCYLSTPGLSQKRSRNTE